MIIDVATFKLFIPSFAKTSSVWIQMHLDASKLVCLEEVYEARTAEAVFYHAAARMTLDPAGFGAKLDKGTIAAASVYEKHWRDIALSCGAAGWRVT